MGKEAEKNGQRMGQEGSLGSSYLSKHGQGLMREQGRASVRSSMVETKSIEKLVSKAFKRELYLPKGGDLLGPGVGFG